MALQDIAGGLPQGVPVTFGQSWRLLKTAVYSFIDDRAMTMGAAMAYYTVFALAPVLIIVIAIAGLVFGHDAAQGAIVDELAGLLGVEGAKALEDLIQSAQHRDAGIVATVLGVVTFLLAATGVFSELETSLNVIWRAPPIQGSAILALLRSRLLSLTILFGLGFLLLVSLAMAAALTAFGNYLDARFPGLKIVLVLLNFWASYGIEVLLFAMIYKVLPTVPIAWSDVWVGAFITALLFEAGKFLIGWYIGNTDLASSYGAAGALIVVLVWVYYSSQILLFGAEIAHAYSRRHGSQAGPDRRSGQDRRRGPAPLGPEPPTSGG